MYTSLQLTSVQVHFHPILWEFIKFQYVIVSFFHAGTPPSLGQSPEPSAIKDFATILEEFYSWYVSHGETGICGITAEAQRTQDH